MLSQKLTRHWSVTSLCLLLLSAGWIWLSAGKPDSSSAGQIQAPQTGFSAPDFSLPTIAGEPITLSQLRGKPVLLNFWASWCAPCRAEMPALQTVYQDFTDQGFIVLGVNATGQDSLTDVLEFVERLNLTFPILTDDDGIVSQRYQVRSLPTSFFIDQQGVIQDIVVGGPMSEASLRIRITQLFEEGR